MLNFYNDEDLVDDDKWKRMTSVGSTIILKGLANSQA